MTSTTTRRFRRPATILTAAAAAAVLAGGLTASAALAGTPAPTPTPSVSAPAPLGFSLPGQGNDQKMRPEAFDILISSVGDNHVDAYGPVHGLGGTDTQFAPFLDQWTFAAPDTGTVNVLHQVEPKPTLDLKTCTATITLHDGWWKFAGGTGQDQGAKGSGLFTEQALFSFAVDRHGKCDFDQHGQLHAKGGSASYGNEPYMRDHGRDLRPVFFSVEIQGTGTASVRHHEECPPAYHAPDNNAAYGSDNHGDQGNCPAPTTAPTGQPTGTPTH